MDKISADYEETKKKCTAFTDILVKEDKLPSKKDFENLILTKEARIRRALLAFSKVRVIANLDDATWKTIAEDEGIADQYAE